MSHNPLNDDGFRKFIKRRGYDIREIDEEDDAELISNLYDGYLCYLDNQENE